MNFYIRIAIAITIITVITIIGSHLQQQDSLQELAKICYANGSLPGC